MKAKEAPEKIYRTTTYLDNDRGKTLWKTKQVAGAENIEYTRTDAFIEKATEWLTKHARKYYFKERCLGTEELVEDFKISMEL